MEEIEQCGDHISRRTDAEEDELSNAELIITSTRNEIEDQYEIYDCCTQEKMARNCRTYRTWSRSISPNARMPGAY